MQILGVILAYLVEKFGRGAVKVSVLIGFYSIITGVILSFVYMVFDKLVVVKNLISQIIDLITQLTSSQGCFGNIFNALLSVFGISSAFNSLSSIFFSAITFILMVILYKILFKIHYFFSEKLTNILSMV